MQKISLSSSRISELIENPKPSLHKRRLFSRFALGMIGIQDVTGITASFRQMKRRSLHSAIHTPPRDAIRTVDELPLNPAWAC
ncbi:MAG: hypothetical protein JWL77_4859 [Chthonomonadaceae bacterium]|nr:hypothetical protein [Chthonomonadaceae bacterium]